MTGRAEVTIVAAAQAIGGAHRRECRSEAAQTRHLRLDLVWCLAVVAAAAAAVLGRRTVRHRGLAYRRPAPLLADQFHLNTDRRWLNPSLLIGSALFGIGWGISGYCPGPALAQLAAPNAETWLFLPAVIVGSALSRLIGRS